MWHFPVSATDAGWASSVILKAEGPIDMSRGRDERHCLAQVTFEATAKGGARQVSKTELVAC